MFEQREKLRIKRLGLQKKLAEKIERILIRAFYLVSVLFILLMVVIAETRL